ncbi:MAG: hypothetical protein V2A78_02085 [bacterium]
MSREDVCKTIHTMMGWKGKLPTWEELVEADPELAEEALTLPEECRASACSKSDGALNIKWSWHKVLLKLKEALEKKRKEL